MIGAVVTLRGIRVQVVPDGPSAASSCAPCVFGPARGGCPTAVEERAAGIQPCYNDKGHHYVKGVKMRKHNKKFAQRGAAHA